MFSSRLVQNITLAVAALIFLLAVVWAFVAGSRAGRAAVIIKNTTALRQGLQFFYDDQNRYPSSTEFADRNIMLNYFSQYPAPNLGGGGCPQTHFYSSSTAKTYELQFCLPKARANFSKGWNTLTN